MTTTETPTCTTNAPGGSQHEIAYQDAYANFLLLARREVELRAELAAVEAELAQATTRLNHACVVDEVYPIRRGI